MTEEIFESRFKSFIAMRKIAEHRDNDGRKSVVMFDHGNREYIVRFYNHRGVHMDASDYFTDDREDAIGTAKLMTGETT